MASIEDETVNWKFDPNECDEMLDPNWDPMAEAYYNQNFNSYKSGSLQIPVHGDDKNLYNKLYVAGIPADMSEDGIKNLFSSAGKILKVKLMPSKQKLNEQQGFVDTASSQDALKVVSHFNNFKIGQFSLFVRVRDPNRKPLHVRKAEEAAAAAAHAAATSGSVSGDESTSKGFGQSPDEIIFDPRKGLSGLGRGGALIARYQYLRELKVGKQASDLSKISSQTNSGVASTVEPTPVPKKSAPRKAKSCIQCKKMGSKFCKVCKACYCSVECQRKNWPFHKLICKPTEVNEWEDAFEEKFDICVDFDIDDIIDAKENGLLLRTFKKAKCLDDFRKRKLPVGNQIKVAVSSQITSPSDLWFVRHEDDKILADLTASMNKCYNDDDSEWQVVYKPNVGNVVACRFDDNSWYRAVVLESLDENLSHVRFLDYGNESVVHFEDMQELKDKFTSEPLMAIHCTLANVIPISGNWSSKATDFLSEKLPYQCVCLLTAHGCNSGKYSISLSDEAGNDIGKMMVQARFALRLPKSAAACVSPNQDLMASRTPSSSNSRQPSDSEIPVGLSSEQSSQKELPISIISGSTSRQGSNSGSSICPSPASTASEQQSYQGSVDRKPGNDIPRQKEEAIEDSFKDGNVSCRRMGSVSDKQEVSQSAQSGSDNESQKQLNSRSVQSGSDNENQKQLNSRSVRSGSDNENQKQLNSRSVRSGSDNENQKQLNSRSVRSGSDNENQKQLNSRSVRSGSDNENQKQLNNRSVRSGSDNENQKQLNSRSVRSGSDHPGSGPNRTASSQSCSPLAGFSNEQIVRRAMLHLRGPQRCPTAGSKVTVSHVNSPSDFFVMLQDDTAKAELHLIHNLLAHYVKYDNRSYRPSRVGWIVCAQYQGTWYRAMVMEILQGSLFKVLFVDFGNTEVVTHEELRCVPGKVWSGLPAWQAFNCGIVGLVGCEANGAWSGQAVAWFSENCTDQSFVVSSAAYRRATEPIDLDLEFAQPVDGLKSLSGILISRKFGRAKVASDSCHKETVYSRDAPAIPEELANCERMTSPQKTSNEPARRDDPRMNNMELERCLLKDLPEQEVNEEILVEVLLTDDPDSFWCQDLVLMQEFAKDGPITPSTMMTSYVPVIDEVCLGYHEVYAVWYRAVVKAVTSDRATVKWIDYGDDADVSFANLRPLTEERFKYPRLAYHCSLADVKTPNGTVDWPTESTEAFKSFVTEKLIKMKIVETSTSGMSYVHLTVVESGSSVASLLINSRLAVLL